MRYHMCLKRTTNLFLFPGWTPKNNPQNLVNIWLSATAPFHLTILSTTVFHRSIDLAFGKARFFVDSFASPTKRITRYIGPHRQGCQQRRRWPTNVTHDTRCTFSTRRREFCSSKEICVAWGFTVSQACNYIS